MCGFWMYCIADLIFPYIKTVIFFRYINILSATSKPILLWNTQYGEWLLYLKSYEQQTPVILFVTTEISMQ